MASNQDSGSKPFRDLCNQIHSRMCDGEILNVTFRRLNGRTWVSEFDASFDEGRIPDLQEH